MRPLSLTSRDPSAPAVLPLRPPQATQSKHENASPAEGSEKNDASPVAVVRSRDATLRMKITGLLLMAVAGGAMIAYLESWLGHRLWPLSIGLSVLVIGLIALASRWICGPVEDLIDRIDTADENDRSAVLSALPTHRGDEIGRLARALHRIGTDATRDRHEARRLRKTIDERIDRATKVATRNLKELAMRDALTDLGNRRFLDENFRGLFESCVQADTDLVCIAIDVDNFKPLNDTLGHGAGDELLRSLGSIIRATIRHEDYAVRLGGDEFIILMPGCPLIRAREVGEQLIGLFRQHARVVIKTETKPNLSLGISSLLRDRAATPMDLLKRADEYLYQAKRGGKGRLAGA